MERTILHVDMNNFYATVECLYHPELQGKAIAVGGDAEKRHGIVLAKSEAAKKCGVKTGETLWQAKRKCPEILFVPPHFELYQKYSLLAKEIYAEYSDRVESFGLDECWLDVTNSPHFGGNGKLIADEIRRRIKEELGLTASVGVSFNKIFAKLGSDMKKPDATTVIAKENFRQKVWPLSVSELLFVGRATKERLDAHGIVTIGDLARAEKEMLRQTMGKNGVTLWEYANGNDNTPVARLEDEREVKSIGNSTTTPHDLVTEEEIKITLYALCESVAARLREQNLVCRTVQITLKDSSLRSIDRQGKLDFESCVSSVLFDKAFQLYRSSEFSRRPLRLLGVRACELSRGGAEQLSWFGDHEKMQRREDEERAIDKIRERFGHFSVQRGIMMMDSELSGINPKERHKAPVDTRKPLLPEEQN
ncbi:MAG: DNA polymerase IV [Clostridia bacterium]|nr:DNA polymerase IV [Clostridia bacterium]